MQFSFPAASNAASKDEGVFIMQHNISHSVAISGLPPKAKPLTPCQDLLYDALNGMPVITETCSGVWGQWYPASYKDTMWGNKASNLSITTQTHSDTTLIFLEKCLFLYPADETMHLWHDSYPVSNSSKQPPDYPKFARPSDITDTFE